VEIELTQDEWAFVLEHQEQDVSAMALRMRRFPNLDAAKVLNQIAGFQTISRKVPSWTPYPNVLFPAKLPLEQCSSEPTAVYKAQLISRLDGVHRMADLTGGLGVDFSFMARNCSNAYYLERQELLCQYAAHNLKVLGLNSAIVLNVDGAAWVEKQVGAFDLLYLDPARRDQKGSKVAALSDCEPDLTVLRPMLLRKTRFLLVKLSPMLDIALALRQLPETVEVHVLSVDGECKELLFLLSSEVSVPEPRIYCVNLRTNKAPEILDFTRSEESGARVRYSKMPQGYLYEPNASLLKAGAFGLSSERFDVDKLHVSSHLYTSDALCLNFPGRSFSIESVFPAHSKSVKEQLIGVDKANITVRNFPETVDRIRKKTGLKEGGDVYLFATTLYDNQKVCIKCRKIDR
jgi:hypothetical protein